MKQINTINGKSTDKGEIVLYQSNNVMQMEVRVYEDTVWLTQEQIAVLFGTKRPAITKHLKNIFNSGELTESSVSSILELTAADRKNYRTKFYNLDAILSVGYRVNSMNATAFRRWANDVLKKYLLEGHTINQRFERIESRLTDHDRKINFFVKTSLPPHEGIFYDGQIFDAYVFAAKLIKSAKSSIILIDNYIDESVLLLLSKRCYNVKVTVYTARITQQLKLDLQRHNEQYPQVEIREFKKSHDRFLIIDSTVYHIGASLKDLGKKWFAFAKMKFNFDANKFAFCPT